jgi:hypothetical protein
MTRKFIPLLILLALSASIYTAHAIGLGLGDRFGRLGSIKSKGGGSPPASNFLLSNAGSALLVDVGSKFLVQ